MRQLLKILLSLYSLRKAFGFGVLFSLTKFNQHLEIIRKFNLKKVLILSPHPDDDILGLGGTMGKLAKDGAKIVVAYFCDGSGGIPIQSIEPVKTQYDKNLIYQRKEEAKAAGKILKVSEQVFFGYPDGKLASGTSSIRALADLIERVKPEIIFVPSFWDNHPDHRVTNEILINAFSETNISCEIWAYEVWTPLFPNRLVPINDFLEQKKKAILEYQSQLKSRGYDKAILALNQYRGEINNVSGAAEAFFATTPKLYQELYRKS